MPAVPRLANPAPLPGRWAMVARAFACQNVAIGCAFGSVAVMLVPLQQAFHADRAILSLGLAAAVFLMSAFAPVTAMLITRFGLRATMLTGIAISGTGYALLAVVPNITLFLLTYSVFIGLGLSLFGSLPASVLASEWSQPEPGTAIGIANVPLFVALIPILGTYILAHAGLKALFCALALIHLGLLPLAIGIREPRRTLPDQTAPHLSSAPREPQLLSSPLFWLLVAGAGLMNAVGIINTTHFVAVGLERGLVPSRAALLITAMGTASMAGSLIIGTLCRWLSPEGALALLAAGFCAGWAFMLAEASFPLMITGAMCAGVSGSGVFPAVNVALGLAFGQASLARALALFGVFALPLTFLLPPLAGGLRDMTGSYVAVAQAIIAGCLAVMVIFIAAAFYRHRGRRRLLH